MSEYSMQALSLTKTVDTITVDHQIGTCMAGDSVLEWAGTRLQTLFTKCDLSFEDGRVEGIAQSVRDFYSQFLAKTPEARTGHQGSTSSQGLLPLWVIARLIRPATLIESGVFVGGSLRMFRQALPEARILAYDISFGPLKYHDDSIEYHETDWMQRPPEIRDAEVAMAFFDDHINAIRRLEEARQRGIRWVVFDDNPHVGALGRYRYPSLPSVPMIMDETFPDQGIMEWTHPGSDKPLRYVHDAKASAEIRQHIRGVANIGGMMYELGLSTGDKWLVELS